VAARYPLDADWVAISGYSMGGHGTYKLATQFPDLFAAGHPVVGPPGQGIWTGTGEPIPGGARTNTFHMLASLRHVPFLMWVAAGDQLVPIGGTQRQARGFDDLGYRYIFDVFAPADHLTLAIHDQYQPAADWLGERTVGRDPARVTYVVNPKMDFGDVRTVADHAYWLSGLRLRNEAVSAQSSAAPRGRIDVRSEGFGVGDPPPSGTRAGGGALTGGNLGALAYQEQSKDWGETPAAPARNRLAVTARNIASVTVHPRRARVNCRADIEVDSDGPLSVTLAGCSRRVRCLPRRGRVGRRGLGPLKLGKRRRDIVRRAGSPARRTRHAYRYCVNGGGRAAAVFRRRGRAKLVMSSARGHRARGVRPGDRQRRLRTRGARPAGGGVYRAGRFVFRVRRGRVRAVGVATPALARNARLLRTYVRRARV
jgi:hypothetical protein